MKYFQQGDVCMFPIKNIPSDAKYLSTNILQSGEATNHHHRLIFRHDDISGGAVYQHPQTLKKYFEVKKPTDLTHEEHKTITVPPGIYEVRIVVEYSHFDEEARNVAD